MKIELFEKISGAAAFALGFAGLIVIITYRLDSVSLGLVLTAMLLFSGLWVRSLSVRERTRPGTGISGIVLDERNLRQRFRLERLEGVSGHSEDWMRGFAEAAEFLVRNYLAPRQTSMTEEAWWDSCMAAWDGAEPFGPDTLETVKKSYVDYMLYSLFDGAGVTADEYARIASMIKDDDVRETLSMTFYSDRLRTSGSDCFDPKEGAAQ